MKAVISGGGTGGHIYPALAVADSLNKKGWEIEYIGSSDSLEKEIISNTEYNFEEIRVLPLPRKLNFKLLKAIFYSIKAVINSYRLIKNMNPDIVFGTGGYVSGPVVLGAFLKGIPTVIHEQNIYPGVTNKLLSHIVNRIAVNNIEASKYFSRRVRDKLVETGNPIREAIIETSRQKGISELNLNPEYKTLFIMGGSQGSETLNNAVINSIEGLMDLNDIQIIFITGKKNYQRVVRKLKDKPKLYEDRLKIKPYLDNIEWAYAAADLIVYRAGATGIAEITGRGLPAILVPFPHSAEDHQKINAKFMEKENAAVMVEDEKFNGDKLFELASEILLDEKKLRQMSKNSKNLSILNADQNILKIIEDEVRED